MLASNIVAGQEKEQSLQKLLKVFFLCLYCGAHQLPVKQKLMLQIQCSYFYVIYAGQLLLCKDEFVDLHCIDFEREYITFSLLIIHAVEQWDKMSILFILCCLHYHHPFFFFPFFLHNPIVHL